MVHSTISKHPNSSESEMSFLATQRLQGPKLWYVAVGALCTLPGALHERSSSGFPEGKQALPETG